MTMTKTGRDAAAKARLEKTGRACDGCGNTIGRWTSKCWYDAELDRCYCSTGGCAKLVTESTDCSQCAAPINPFEDEVSQYGGSVYCSGCMEQFDPYELPESVMKLDVSVIPGTSKKDVAAVLEGPYFPVLHLESGSVQVVRSEPNGTLFVRSANVRPPRAVALAAQFNKAA